jgi:hypothetical protein
MFAYRQHVYLYIAVSPVFLCKLECVPTVRIYVPVTQRGSAVAEQLHDLVGTFLIT